jgi:hypothetical protein
MMGFVLLCGLAVLFVSTPVQLFDLIPNLARPPGGRSLDVAFRLMVFGAGPLACIYWQRKKGGRGIMGGLLGGTIIYGSYAILDDCFSETRDPFSFGIVGDTVIYAITGCVHGFVLGIVAYVFFLGARDVRARDVRLCFWFFRAGKKPKTKSDP